MMDISTVKFSDGLEEEIEWKLAIEHEDPYDRLDAILEICEDCEDDECPAYEFRRELRALMIALGVYREVTKDQLEKICTFAGGRTRSATSDFRMNKKMYLFESWEPMHKAMDSARQSVNA